MKTRLLTLIAGLLFMLPAYANSTLDKLFEKAEKIPDAKVIVSERRNPDNGKVIRLSTSIECNSSSIYEDGIKAFEAQRKVAIEYSRVSNESLHAVFIEDGYKQSYSMFMSKGSKKVTLVMSSVPYTTKRTKTGEQ